MGPRMELMLFAFLVFATTGFLLFAKHIRYYKQAVKSLKSRGFQTKELEVSFSNFGSVGCMRKIRLVRAQYANSLTLEENELLSKSSRLYNLQAPLVIIFIVVLVCLSSLE